MKRTFLIMFVLAGALAAQQTLEDLGVKGIQAFFNGSPQEFDRFAKMVDDDLVANPNHALAKVLHGLVTFRRSGDAASKGDMADAGKLFESSIAEMDQAVRLEPDNPGVRVPRGAALIAASRTMPAPMGKPLLESGISDFEHILKLHEQDGSFPKRSNHQRGELLTGLADGWARAGNEAKGRAYFERIVKDLPGTIYQTRAQAWLDGKPESKSPEFFDCVGCHLNK